MLQISQVTPSPVGIAGNNSCFVIRQWLHLDRGVGGPECGGERVLLCFLMHASLLAIFEKTQSNIAVFPANNLFTSVC